MAEVKYIIRVANTDLDGRKRIFYALQKIKGVGFMFANAVLKQANVPLDKLAGELSDEEVERINGVIADPIGSGIPAWMVNRRKDYESGVDKHLVLGDLGFVRDNDIKRLKKIKAYRGVRHHLGLPVRGQKTKSNFRKNKGKVMGVNKKKK